MREPKRWAFRIDDGEPVDAAHALAGTGLYEYGGHEVHRKRLPGGAATEDRSWYFAFTSLRRDEPDAPGGAAAASAVRAMAQAILWEKRFVQCTVDGELFSADLTDVVRERAREADLGVLHGTRRPDVRARAVRASDPRINGRPLDVEIAVSGDERGYDRVGQLMRARACLELSVARDEHAEGDPALLEEYLRGGLLSGAFTARWLVAPDGAKAGVKPVDEVRQLLDHQGALFDDELACAQGEVSAAQMLLAACADTSGAALASGDVAAVARLEAERDALLALVDARDHDGDATSLVWLVAGTILPRLREPRLRTREKRLARLRSELRARFDDAGAARRGLMKRIEAFDRALHAPMSRAAACRAEAESLAAFAAVSVRHARARVERVAEYRRRLDELEAAGARELLFPPGTSLRATIAYEHRRRFGSGAREPSCA